jgi:hypothetical protein
LMTIHLFKGEEIVESPPNYFTERWPSGWS